MAATIEQLIAQRFPEASRILETGTTGAIDAIKRGTSAGVASLSPFTGTGALAEQAALLGLSGRDAQTQAISGIPISGATMEAQESQRRQQQRQAAAFGDLGSGATLLEGQQLAGSQQAQNIFNRLAELDPLVNIAARSSGVISGFEERESAEIAALLQQLGISTAEIGLGGAAGVVQERTRQAELDALRTIAGGQETQQIMNQISQLASRIPTTPSTPQEPVVRAV
jgi:hypothetical protein